MKVIELLSKLSIIILKEEKSVTCIRTKRCATIWIVYSDYHRGDSIHESVKEPIGEGH